MKSARANRVPIAVAVLTAAAFVLRLSQIHQSLYGDEVWTYQDVVGHSLLTVLRTVHTGSENSPPLFFALAWLSAKLGDPTVWIRLPSLILGTATIPLIYALGRETFGRDVGAVAAAVMAAGPFSIYYGIEARPYATMTFFVTLSTLAVVKAVRTGSRRWWAVYVLSAAAGAYTHYTAVFVLAIQAGWSLWICRDRLREPLIANLGIVLLYMPWLPHVRGKSLGVISLLQPLTVHNVINDLMRPIPGYPYASLRAIPSVLGLAAIATCAAAGLFALFRRWRQSSLAARLPERPALIVLLAAATPVGLLIYSMLGTDLWLARGLYASVPAATLVLAALLVALPRSVRSIGIAVVIATLIIGTIRAVSPGYARPPFRAVASYLDRVASYGDPIIIYPSFVDPAIPAQFKRPHRVVSASATQWRSVRPGATAYVIIDDKTALLFNIGTPHPPGFQLLARRHYRGLVWFSLLTYRATAARVTASRTRSRTQTS